MSILWLTENLINSGTPLYSSTEDSTYGLENLYNRRPSFPFRFQGDRQSPRVDPEWICVDLVETKIVDFVGVFNHNLQGISSGVEFSIKGCDLPCPGLSGNCNWDSLPSGTCDEDLLDRIVANFRNSYKIINCYNRYFYLGISEVNVAIPQIGEWVLGKYNKFSRNIHLQQGAGDSQKFSMGTSETHYGQPHDNFYSEKHEFSLTFNNLGNKEIFSEFSIFARTVMENGNRFILVLDDDTKFCYYCRIKNFDRMSRRIVYGREGTLKEWRIDIETLPEGIEIL